MVSSGSRITLSGIKKELTTPFFHLSTGSLTIALGVTSAPVPEVVCLQL